jgi:drug/metabolite transporter (DMT)-like permease
MKEHPIRAALWMIVAQILFSSMNIGARLGGASVPWQEVAGTRFVVGALTAMIVARARGSSLRVVHQKEQLWRSLFGTIAALGTFYTLAQREVAVGDAVTLFATSPIFVALASWPLLGEKVARSVLMATAVGFAGIVAVAQPTFATAPHLVASGALTAISSAFAMIWLRRMGPGESSEAIVFQFSVAGAVTALALSIPVWHTPDARSAMYLVGTGLSGGLAQIALTRAYSLDRAARVSSMGYANIVFTRAFAFPVFDERPTSIALVGSVLVIGSGIAVALRGQARAARVAEG